MKNIIYLLGSILLIVLLQMYIVGGYENQTVESKSTAIVLGLICAGFIVGYNEIKED